MQHFTYLKSFDEVFVDLAFSNQRYHLLMDNGGETILRVLDSNFNLVSDSYYPQAPKAIFIHGNKKILVTEDQGTTSIRVLEI